MNDKYDLAIVGGGLSGSTLALHLKRRGWRGRLAIVEPGALGLGLAYSTRDPDHLLNVYAGRMGVYADAPGDFADWMAARDLPWGPSDFVPRALYGEYVAARLTEAGGIDHRQARAEDLFPEGGGYRLKLSDGSELLAGKVVLALGNFRPRWPGVLAAIESDPRLIADPWDRMRQADLPQGARVLLVGTGLTMIDVALTLAGSGHTAPMLAVSRHGLLPQPHLPIRAAAPPVQFADLPASPLGILRWLRAKAREGGDWGPWVDALRPVTQALWRSWSGAERARFLRHAKTYWEVHRHRLAPPVVERLRGERANGWLHLMAGRVASVDASGPTLKVEIDQRGGGQRRVEVDAIVNCTGPCSDPRRAEDPFLDKLLTQGLVQPDAFGLLTDEAGALMAADGKAVEGLYALGPLTKPALWEITAVPDIRTQASQLATLLAP
ncbi:FAD/NAD(P)-binding protein [Lacibacterium aquatile]|uniref:FAD/NAD(P)-binding protein n=1 Tax=Lacibacterium aquatile TaxID=1168082 RepID=A0ABW5DN11_9PROT